MASKEKQRKAKVTPENRAESARLRALWEEAGRSVRGTQAEFGKTYGVGNQSAVGQFLRGDVPISLGAAIAFAKVLGREVADFSPRLAAEIAAGLSVVQAPTDEFTRIRRAAVAFSQGHGRVVYDEGQKAPLSFRRDYLRRIGVTDRAAVVVDAEGHSNEPVISDGAVLLVNCADKKIRDGRFYAFRWADELFVKRLYQARDGTIKAVSENQDRTAYPDMLIDGKGDFELIGRRI